MLNELIMLKKKFDKIEELGWVETMREGTTGIGYTFETLIGKEEESFPIPDFGSIEIKTRFKNGKEDMTLFNATPDGDYLFPMKRMYDQYGFFSQNNPNLKIFYASISSFPTYAGKKNKFKLIVDDEKRVIKIIVIDKAGNISYTDTSWSFDFLKEKLERKLKYLALIKADCKYKLGKQCFYYNQFSFYALRGFDEFIQMIKEGIIKTTFMIGCYKSGPKAGQMNNHGVGFDISESNLEKLFYKVF